MQNKKVIGIVVIILVAGLSFWGGMMLAGKNIKAAAASRQNSFAQNGGARGQGMRGGALGGAVSGEILSKDATSMTIKLQNGGSKIVLFSPTSKVVKTVDGTVADVVVGKSVMITGTANPDGSVSATSIQLRPTLPAGTPVKTN